MKLWRPLTDRLAPLVGKWYLSLVACTTRIEYRNWEHYQAADRPVIFAFWHGRLALLTTLWRDSRVHMIVSRHRDGEIIARIAAAFNRPSVRGSSTRGGAEALRQLARLLRRGERAGITPDGPKGPRQVCQPGVIALARMTGCPIIPVSYSVRRKRFLGSWDRFLLPYPFNRALVIQAAPIEVEKNCSEEVMEAKRQELERALNAITEEADQYFA